MADYDGLRGDAVNGTSVIFGVRRSTRECRHGVKTQLWVTKCLQRLPRIMYPFREFVEGGVRGLLISADPLFTESERVYRQQQHLVVPKSILTPRCCTASTLMACSSVEPS